MSYSIRPLLLLTLCGLMLASGCARQTGQRGQLIFMYDTPGDPLNFNKPIAQGHTLELFMHSVREDMPVEILEVKSSDPGVLRPTGKVAHLFGVRALKPGRARLLVKAVDEQGRVYRDVVVMRVGKIARTELAYACETMQEDPSQPPLYLAGARDVFVPWARHNEAGELLTGYGEFPVEVVPASAASIRTNRTVQTGLSLDIQGNPGVFELRAEHGGAQLKFESVERAAIDGIWMHPWDAGAWMLIGGAAFVSPEPQVKGRPLCTHDLQVSARSLTPEICEVAAISGEHIVELVGKAWGICRYEVGYEGVRAQHTARVGKLPGDEEEEPEPPLWLAPLLAMILVPLGAAPLLLRRQRRA